MEIFELRKSMTFESAHKLIGLPTGHKCGRLHGHSFKATLVVQGPLDKENRWVIDYADIKKAAAPTFEQLDHNYLNDIPGLENPTAENICRWIFQNIKPRLPMLVQVIVSETCTSESRYPIL